LRLVPAAHIDLRLSPRVNVPQMRRLLRLGIMLRWVAICFAGLAGPMSGKPSNLLFYLILVAAIYNSAVMFAATQVTDAAARRLAVGVTLADMVFGYLFIGVIATAFPQGGQVAFYVFAVIEAVAYFGVAGAVISVLAFIGLSAMDAAYQFATGASFSPTASISRLLLVAVSASAVVGVNRILLTPVDPGELAPGLRLSPREQEVLRLVAEGYSNTMIASRLKLSDNTVKSYVENLLTRLNARNRAEAVAAASRLKLI
jgi:DNA-binding CsgD family transcriptional regulator